MKVLEAPKADDAFWNKLYGRFHDAIIEESGDGEFACYFVEWLQQNVITK